MVLRAVSRLKSLPLVRRHYHPMLRAGLALLARHPVLRRTARLAGPLMPGLRTYLRRVAVPPAPAELAPLVLSDIVTVEQLRALSRVL